MSSFILEAGKKIDSNFWAVILLLVLAEVLLLNFSIPLNWFCHLVGGYVFWQIKIEDYPQVFSLLLLPPILIFAYDSNIISFLFTASMLLESVVIYFVRRVESWSFAIEILTIMMLGLLFFADTFFPEYEQLFIKYIANIQNTQSGNLDFLPGLMLLGLGVEILLFCWLSSRWRHKVKKIAAKITDSANEVRVSLSMLIITVSVAIAVYLSQLEFKSYSYLLTFPYFLAGLSCLTWGFKAYKTHKKNSSNNGILLIFILLYATFMPLALGFVGLLDVGLNLRKKYDIYLNRR